MALTIMSPAFHESDFIPKKHTCQGSDQSPALSWADVPAGAKSLALIVDDPDAPAGTWVHWVLFNVPAGSQGLPEGVPSRRTLEDGSRQGANDFHKIGYNGPCPPPGGAHRYFFKLYALDSILNLEAGAIKPQVEQAMRGHILAECRLMGRFRRS
jgi:Raf kinase inhibitor-like YbhB/YbcL family protein